MMQKSQQLRNQIKLILECLMWNVTEIKITLHCLNTQLLGGTEREREREREGERERERERESAQGGAG